MQQQNINFKDLDDLLEHFLTTSNYKSKSNITTSKRACKIYKIYFSETNDYKKEKQSVFSIKKSWDSLSYFRFFKWLESLEISDIGKITTLTFKYEISNALFRLMGHASDLNIISERPSRVGSKEKINPISVAYTESEINFIQKFLDDRIKYAINLSKNPINELITKDIIIPLVASLIFETGLNVESALALKVGCLKERHPLTGQSYLEYYKERSTGEAWLDLSILGQKSSLKVKSIINLTLKLTEHFRSLLDIEKKEKLFIIEKSGYPFGPDELDVVNLACWYIKNKNTFIDTEGNAFRFTLKKIRTTKTTQMVLDGYNERDIKAMLNHDSFNTTYRYIDNNKINSKFNKAVKESSEKIYDSSMKYMNQVAPKKLYKTGLANCINPFSPPEQLKDNSPICTKWAMCLLCKNFVLTKNNLPILLSYYYQIKVSIPRVSEMIVHGSHYKKLLKILEQLLEPDYFFTKEELSDAHKTQGLLTPMSDIVFQGVI